MIYGMGMQELLVILAIVMLLFGGKKLPEVGKNLGKAIRGFKESEEETRKELQKAVEEEKKGAEDRDTAEEKQTAEAVEEKADETKGSGPS